MRKTSHITTTSSRQSSETRQINKRNLIKFSVLGAGIAAGKSWEKPITNAVVLPAHAATTEDAGPGTSPTTPEATTVSPTTVEPTTSPLPPSDIRLKKHIESLGQSREGFKLYRFNYLDKSDPKTYVGIMAQDIADTHPQALARDEAGYYRVNYAKLGLRMVTLDQWQVLGPESVEINHQEP